MHACDGAEILNVSQLVAKYHITWRSIIFDDVDVRTERDVKEIRKFYCQLRLCVCIILDEDRTENMLVF